MNPTIRLFPCFIDRLRRACVLLLAIVGALGAGVEARAADILWSGGADHGGSLNDNTHYWSTAANWDGGVAPGITDNAVIGDTANSINAYIYFYFTVSNSVGSITVQPASTNHNMILQGNANSTTLSLFGVNGILITNANAGKQLQWGANGGNLFILKLQGSGDIGTGTATSSNLMYIQITDGTNGPAGITKTGPGIINTYSNFSYSGGTTLKGGTIRLAAATASLGSGPITFAGGELSIGSSRYSVPPFSNSVVVTGNSTISADGTLTGWSTANARYVIFSGDLSGTNGTLTLTNKGVAGNYFISQFNHGFNFVRPIVLGSTASRYAVLQLANTLASGDQTFSGVISGAGQIDRSLSNGVSIFTAASTYSGGTTISNGTVLANNTAGSALGSGPVTVASQGVLGGSGSVQAAVTVYTGGTLSPGAAATNVSNLTLGDVQLTDGVSYIWQIKSADGTPGVDWDLLAANSVWDASYGAQPITIKISSQGIAPTGWNSGVARDWLILQTPSYSGFDPSHYSLDLTSFAGNIGGVFSLNVAADGLHLLYTPAGDLVINVPTGTETQAEANQAQISGTQGLVKTGAGELVLDNPGNDYVGSTKVLAGTLSLNGNAMNGSGVLGSSSTATYVGDTSGTNSATLNVMNGATMARDIVVQSGSTGVKTLGTASSANYSGNVNLQDSATLDVATGGSATFSGNFSGAGGLALSGGGSISLSGNGSYAGPTTISIPSLNLTGPAFGTNTITFAAPTVLDSLGISPVTLHDSPLSLNADVGYAGSYGLDLSLGAGPVTLNGGRALTVSGAALVLGGPISGSGSLTKLGLGNLTLGGTNTYSGNTTNSEGTITLGAPAGFGTGTLVLAGGSVAAAASHVGAALSSPVIMTTDTRIFGVSMASPAALYFLPFSGPFSVPGGTSTLTIGNAGRSASTFALRFQGNNITSVDWPIVIGDYNNDSPGALSQLDLYSDTNAPAQIISGLISGYGSVRRGNATPNTGGTSILTGLNTFSGGAYLTGGALGFGSDGGLTEGPIGTGLFTIGDQTTTETNMTVFAYGASRVIDNPIYLNGAQNINFTGTNNLTFTGPINAGGIAKTWTVKGAGVAILSGQITASGDGAPLNKAGSGTLVLSADNQYTGATTVKQGTLLVNNPYGSGTGSGNIAVQSGATIGGTGTVAGRVTATSGYLAPGSNSVGTFTVQGGVNLSSGGTYVWDLAANSTAPGNFDLLAVTGGNTVLGGTSKLAVNLTGSATVPTHDNGFWDSSPSWTILTAASNPGLTKFASIVGGTYPAGYFTNYADVSGNIVLQFIPVTAPPEQPVIQPAIAGAGTSSATLTWSSVSGLTYQVQYKTNLSQPDWITLGSVPATGATASITDTNGPFAQCFYRVIVVQP